MAYDQNWHDFYGAGTNESARRILPHVFKLRMPLSIAEFGCGHAHWLSVGREMGVKDVVGIDGPWTETAKLLIPKGLFHHECPTVCRYRVIFKEAGYVSPGCVEMLRESSSANLQSLEA
jgi:hypothetical protein